MGIFAVVITMPMDIGMLFFEPVPLLPGFPMALVFIAMAFMIVMLVTAVFLVGTISVAAIFIKITTLSMISIAAVIVALPIISVVPMIRASSLVPIALLVFLLVSPPLFSRFVFPIIGKCNNRTAEDHQNHDTQNARRFHQFPPHGPFVGRYCGPIPLKGFL